MWPPSSWLTGSMFRPVTSRPTQPAMKRALGETVVPVSQLDGGHICYAVFGPRFGNWVARGALITSILAVIVTGRTNWVALVVIVTFLGVDHPPIRQEREPIGGFRTALGLAMFAIPVLTFMPEPLLFD